MYVVGLTGNIATGKSTVATMLASLGACAIDADELAHWAMRPETEVHRRIVERFGAEMLRPDGTVNRPKLGSLVFADARALRDLERIVHPAVVEETWRRLAACNRAVGVVEAVKLIEAGMHRSCNAVWVVTCSREQQLDRLMCTRGMTAEEAKVRIAAQPAIEDKLAHAQVVIDNSRALADTWTQVVHAWNAIPGATPVPVGTPRLEPQRR